MKPFNEPSLLPNVLIDKAYGYQAEVDGDVKRMWSGGLYGWNKYCITCNGNKIRIEVNGVIITDIEDDMDATGPIGIQHHGEKGAIYKFRNLRIRKLK